MIVISNARDDPSAPQMAGLTPRLFAALLAATLLVACPQAGWLQALAACDASKAQALRGKPFSDELLKEAQRVSGAQSVRAVGPGGAVSTGDRVPHRLDVEVDEAKIVRNFWCE